jgi:pyrroline-5-carboxylate reductase
MTDETTAPHVAVLGGGVMGETLLSALLTGGWAPEDLEVTERAAVRANELAGRYGVRTGASNGD